MKVRSRHPDRDQAIVEMYRGGAKLKDIALAFNVHHSRITEVARSAGEPPRVNRIPPPKSPAVREAARAGYGVRSAREIAAEHGVSRDAIIGHWWRLRKAGVLA